MHIWLIFEQSARMIIGYYCVTWAGRTCPTWKRPRWDTELIKGAKENSEGGNIERLVIKPFYIFALAFTLSMLLSNITRLEGKSILYKLPEEDEPSTLSIYPGWWLFFLLYHSEFFNLLFNPLLFSFQQRCTSVAHLQGKMLNYLSSFASLGMKFQKNFYFLPWGSYFLSLSLISLLDYLWPVSLILELRIPPHKSNTTNAQGRQPGIWNSNVSLALCALVSPP